MECLKRTLDCSWYGRRGPPREISCFPYTGWICEWNSRHCLPRLPFMSRIGACFFFFFFFYSAVRIERSSENHFCSEYLVKSSKSRLWKKIRKQMKKENTSLVFLLGFMQIRICDSLSCWWWNYYKILTGIWCMCVWLHLSLTVVLASLFFFFFTKPAEL